MSLSGPLYSIGFDTVLHNHSEMRKRLCRYFCFDQRLRHEYNAMLRSNTRHDVCALPQWHDGQFEKQHIYQHQASGSTRFHLRSLATGTPGSINSFISLDIDQHVSDSSRGGFRPHTSENPKQGISKHAWQAAWTLALHERVAPRRHKFTGG